MLSSTQVPLPEVGCKDIVDIQADAADHDTRVGRGDDDGLIEHGRRLALAVRPRLRLPGPRVPRGGGAPDHAVGDRPRTCPRMAIDPGAVHAQHRVDSPKPLDCNAVPGVEVDVLVDAEEDRRRSRAPGRTVPPQSRLSVYHPAVVSTGVIRRGRPTGLAVLIAADDVQTHRA